MGISDRECDGVRLKSQRGLPLRFAPILVVIEAYLGKEDAEEAIRLVVERDR